MTSTASTTDWTHQCRGSNDKTIRIWDAGTSAAVDNLEMGHTDTGER